MLVSYHAPTPMPIKYSKTDRKEITTRNDVAIILARAISQGVIFISFFSCAYGLAPHRLGCALLISQNAKLGYMTLARGSREY